MHGKLDLLVQHFYLAACAVTGKVDNITICSSYVRNIIIYNIHITIAIIIG